MNLADLLSDNARRSPLAPAVVLADATLTYAQLEALVWQAAGFLRGVGVGRGDVVAQAFADEADALVALLATARIGATVFSLPLSLPPLKRAASVARAGATHLVTDSPQFEVDGLHPIVLRRSEVSALPVPAQSDLRDDHPQAPWLLVTGSGSTGEEKLMPMTHRQLMARLEFNRRVYATTAPHRLFSMVGVEFAVGKNACLTMLCHGWTVVLDPRGRVDPIAVCRRFGVTALFATVMHLEQMIAALPATGAPVLGFLRCLPVGASTVSDALRRRIVERLCPNLYVAYGANETGVVTVALPEQVLAATDTVGRVYPGAVVEVVDPDGRVLGPERVGLVRIRSDGMIDGYLGDEAATRQAFRDGWFHPGDLARFTRDGHLIYCGRADHMMIMNGINIYPAEIERVVSSHPAVSDVAVIPLRSTVHQHIPVCAVALRPGALVAPEELQAYARQRLGTSAPAKVVMLERIPRNAQGKLIRPALAEALAAALDARRRDADQSRPPSTG